MRSRAGTHGGAHGAGEKRPRQRGAGGAFCGLGKLRFYLLEYFFIVQVDFLEGFAGLLVREYS